MIGARRLWAAATVICLCLAACGGHPGRRMPRSTDVDENGFRRHMAALTAADFEGRRPGTPGEEHTVAYLTARFQALGLKPGNGVSYLQPVPLVEVTAAADATLKVGGAGGGSASLRYAIDMVIWTRRTEPQVRLNSSELVFAGYGIVAPEFGWNDYAGLDAHGKTVMLLVNDPGHAAHDPSLFHGDAPTYYGSVAYKVEEATRQGASGVLLIHDPGALGFGWPAVVNRWTGPQLQAAAAAGTAAPVGNPAPAAIEGWVTADAARKIFAEAGVDMTTLSLAAGHPAFRPVDLGLKVEAEVRNSIRPISSSNVIAVVPGRAHRRECIIYTAHWDHLGRGGGGPDGPIFPGAVDNASGTAGLLMLAQAFSRTQPAPERTVVFLAVTGGDSGLLGSDWYAGHPLFPLAETVAVLNLDSLRIGGPTRDVTVFGFGLSGLDPFLRDAAALQGRELHPDPNPEQGLFFRSDQFSFAKRGVPVLFAKGGLDDSARGPDYGHAQLDDYNLHRYWQPGDTYSPDWDLRGTLEDLRLYYQVGVRLAQTRRFPNWNPNSEFKAIRDRSREGAND